MQLYLNWTTSASRAFTVISFFHRHKVPLSVIAPVPWRKFSWFADGKDRIWKRRIGEPNWIYNGSIYCAISRQIDLRHLQGSTYYQRQHYRCHRTSFKMRRGHMFGAWICVTHIGIGMGISIRCRMYTSFNITIITIKGSKGSIITINPCQSHISLLQYKVCRPGIAWHFMPVHRAYGCKINYHRHHQ